MKYFTRELYEKDQILGLLSIGLETFMKTEKYDIENNRDFDTMYGDINILLLRYLPESLKGKVNNIRDAIYLKESDDPSKFHIRKELEKWCRDIEQESLNNSKAYRDYMNSIEMLLPENIQVFRSYDFHDALLLKINES